MTVLTRPETPASTPSSPLGSKLSPAQRQDSLDWPQWLCLGFLAALVGLLFFYKLGSYSLFDVDEPRYAEAAREMIVRGSWITPYFNDAIRLEKPVFFYWLLIGSYKLFGVNEFAARFVSAMAASGLVALTYSLAAYCRSRRVGVYAAVILASSLEVIGLARMSITDMTLAFWICSTTASLFMAIHKDARWWLVAGLLAGFGILTKGPVSLVLPGMIATLYALTTGRLKTMFLNRYLPLALVIAAAVALPWYFLAYQENKAIFLDSLYNNNVSRFSGAVDYHSEPPYYYVIVLLVGALPWTPHLVAAGQHVLRQFRKDDLLTYAAFWAVGVFGFFSIADTKLLTYILPMFPGLALVLALTFDAVSTGIHRIAAWTLVGLLAAAGIALTPNLLPAEAGHIADNPWVISGWAALLVGSLLSALMFNRRQISQAVLTHGVTMALVAVIALNGIVPVVNQATQGSMNQFVREVPTGAPLVTYEIIRPSLTFYAQRGIPHIARDDYAKLLAILHQGLPVYIITKNKFIPQLYNGLPPSTQLSIVDRASVYTLLRLTQSRDVSP